MIAAGLDLGGTKIEAQLFDSAWQQGARRRIETPKDYPALVKAMSDLILWAETEAGHALPVGIAAAGLINPATGLALTANLPASGRPFPADIEACSGRLVTYINDCRALALSEATFGAAQGANPALALILGTGMAGGVVIDGHLMPAHATVGGEFGHFPLAAGPVQAHGLPVITCGCGRTGCAETYLAGPGLSRIAAHVLARNLTPEAITTGRKSEPDLARVWAIWLELAAEFLVTLCFTIDPQVIVLGGGLSKAPDLVPDLTAALRRATFAGFRIPEIRLAQGGDASGARGAAFAAWQAAEQASCSVGIQ
jgi:N-acetylglucosamine kinase